MLLYKIIYLLTLYDILPYVLLYIFFKLYEKRTIHPYSERQYALKSLSMNNSIYSSISHTVGLLRIL